MNIKIVLASIFGIFWGLYDIKRNISTKNSDYFSGIQHLSFGSMLLFSIIVYYFIQNDLLLLFLFSITFLFSGIYGILQRKKLKNYLSLRRDYFAVFAGTIVILFIIVGWLGFFST